LLGLSDYRDRLVDFRHTPPQPTIGLAAEKYRQHPTPALPGHPGNLRLQGRLIAIVALLTGLLGG
jgi:hypothetical protein